jgi:CrcB protein
MQQLLAVGCGGFLGAVTRYTLTGMMQKRCPGFMPAGTMLVNVLGCLLIGILMALVTEQVWFFKHETLRRFLMTGVLGSLTTFSTFGYETVELLRESDMRLAAWNVAGNLCLGIAAVWLGLVVTKAIVN